VNAEARETAITSGNFSAWICERGEMNYQKVDVIGLGAVTGYGWGVPQLWDGLMSGKTASRLHAELGSRLPDLCWFARVPEGGDPRMGPTRYARAVAAAADEAIADARARGWTPGERVAVVHCTTGADRELYRERYLDFDRPATGSRRRRFVENLWTTPSGLIMERYQFHGPCFVLSAACSTGVHGIHVAQRLIAAGDATDAIVVSADIGYDGEELRTFAAMRAAIYDRPPEEVCRPLQEDTKGFNLGEAAGAVVLSASGAASGYIRVRASGLGNDAFHPVSIEPSLVYLLNELDAALERTGITGDDIAYYVMHGTGTVQCNNADRGALGRLGPRPIAYGFKPFLGHTMGTAPLMETIITALAYQKSYLPAIPPVTSPHPQLAAGPTAHDGGITAQISIGFGGNVGAIIYENAA
jgi:3-oxoacyl-[acyl-carrier-protein] synthase II